MLDRNEEPYGREPSGRDKEQTDNNCEHTRVPYTITERPKKLDRLLKEPQKARQYLRLFWFSVPFVAVIILIYAWFKFHWPLWVLVLLLLIGILFLSLIIRTLYSEQWTGFSGKTLWDWLQLLGVLAIQLVVVGAPIMFGWWQTQLANVQLGTINSLL